MPYHRDGSRFHLAPGWGARDILNYGWLCRRFPFVTGDVGDEGLFRSLAGITPIFLMRGHHVCEFCAGRDASHGNGEAWIRIGESCYRLPAMIWHYILVHRYRLPDHIVAALRSGDHHVCSESEAEAVIGRAGRDRVPVPAMRCTARWRESRYSSLTKFTSANSATWSFTTAVVEDGHYIVVLDQPPESLDLMFEHQPGDFPDRIEVVRSEP